MFAEINQWVWVEVPPHELGPDFDEVVKRKVRSMYEGKVVDGNYYIAVDLNSVALLDRPIVQDGTCQILCRTRFVSVVFRAFRDETMYVRVGKIHKVGVLADFGPMKIFLSAASLNGWKFVGADSTSRDRFEREEGGGVEISENTMLLVQLQGVRQELEGDFKFHAVATIDGPDLGPVIPPGKFKEDMLSGNLDFSAIPLDGEENRADFDDDYNDGHTGHPHTESAMDGFTRSQGTTGNNSKHTLTHQQMTQQSLNAVNTPGLAGTAGVSGLESTGLYGDDLPENQGDDEFNDLFMA